MCEEYAQEHSLRGVVIDQLVSILSAKPKDVYRFIAEWASSRAQDTESHSGTGNETLASTTEFQTHAAHLHCEAEDAAMRQLGGAVGSQAVPAPLAPLPRSLDSDDNFIPHSPYHKNNLAPLVDRLQNLMPRTSSSSPLQEDSFICFSKRKMEDLNLDDGLNLEGMSSEGVTKTSEEAASSDDPRNALFQVETSGSPTTGEHFVNLGESVVSPLGVPRRTKVAGKESLFPSEPSRTTQSALLSTFGSERNAATQPQDVVVPECDAVLPYPVRMTDATLLQVNLDDHYRSIQRVAESAHRFTAVRIADARTVSIRSHDISHVPVAEQSLLLRDMYAVVVATYRHPNLVRNIDCFIVAEDQRLLVVQEHFGSRITLAQYVREREKALSARLSEEQVKRVMMQLADALHWLHFNGLVHGNIHERNVFVVEKGAAVLDVKLGSFELSLSRGRTCASACVSCSDSFAEDILSLGQMMRRLMSESTCSDALRGVVLAMCDANPKKRPTTALVLGMLANKGVVSILEATNIPVIATDTLGCITVWNRAAESLFEYTAEEVIGKANISVLMRGDMAQQHSKWMKEFSATHIRHQVDSTQIVGCWTKSNKVVSVEMRMRENVNHDCGTEHAGFFAVFRDVSLLHSLRVHHHLRMTGCIIADYVTVPVVHSDDHGIIVEFSRCAAELFGIRAVESIGKSVSILLAPEYAPRFESTCHNTESPTSAPSAPPEVGTVCVVLCKHRSGQLFPERMFIAERKNHHVLSSACLLHARHTDPQSSASTPEYKSPLLTPDSGAAICPPLHEQPPTTRYCTYFLRESCFFGDINNVLMATSDCMVTGMMDVDEYGLIRRVNKTAEEIFDWREHHLLGKNVRVLMDDSIGDVHQEYIERFKKNGVGTLLGVPRHVVGMTRSRLPVKLRMCVQPAYRNGRLWFIALFALDTSEGLSGQNQLPDVDAPPRSAVPEESSLSNPV